MQNILAVTHPFFLLPSYEIRCRQFVEMVNGTDSEVRCFSARSPRSQDSYPGSPSLSPRHGSNNSHVHSTGKCFSCVFWWEEQMLKVNCCILPYLLLSVLWNAPFLFWEPAEMRYWFGRCLCTVKKLVLSELFSTDYCVQSPFSF